MGEGDDKFRLSCSCIFEVMKIAGWDEKHFARPYRKRVVNASITENGD